VLSSDLKLRDNLYGWVLASFRSGTVVFQGSVVHFAPTHPLQLSLYDPQRRLVMQIYPPPRDELLAAYIRRLQKVPASERCHGSNCYDAPDPDELEASVGTMSGETSKLAIAVNEETHALAFLATYSPRGFVSSETEDLPEWRERVVHVYRLSGGISHREFPLEKMQKRYGVARLDDLLNPEMMRRLFPVPAAPR
jgi:hypothetical protein